MSGHSIDTGTRRSGRGFARRLRSPYASTVATISLFFALSGGVAYAANMVTGAQVEDNTLTGIDVADGSLTGADVQDGSITAKDTNLFREPNHKWEWINAGTTKTVEAKCWADRKVISGGYRITSNPAGMRILQSEHNDNGDGWKVTVYADQGPGAITVAALCMNLTQ